MVDYFKIESLKLHIIEGLRDVSVEDTRKLVSLASGIITLLNYSIELNKLNKKLIEDDLVIQIEKRYARLVSK